jgi:hypothetical protein
MLHWLTQDCKHAQCGLCGILATRTPARGFVQHRRQTANRPHLSSIVPQIQKGQRNQIDPLPANSVTWNRRGRGLHHLKLLYLLERWQLTWNL